MARNVTQHRPGQPKQAKKAPEMDKKELPPSNVLSQLLRYDAETGKLWWKKRPVEMFSSEAAANRWNARYSDTEAFTASLKGYKQGRLFNKFAQAHRVIWKLLYDESPAEIDHVNGDPSDNRLCNLRPVDRVENMRNAKTWSHNTSGHRGVNWHKRNRKWQAYIFADKVHHHLGLFESKDDAITARKAAEVAFQFHENHGRDALPSMKGN